MRRIRLNQKNINHMKKKQNVDGFCFCCNNLILNQRKEKNIWIIVFFFQIFKNTGEFSFHTYGYLLPVNNHNLSKYVMQKPSRQYRAMLDCIIDL